MSSDRDQLIALIQSDALQFGDFILASGLRSSYYIDCRTITLSSAGSVLVGRLMLQLSAQIPFDAVAGLTLGADPVISAVLTVAGAVGQPLRGGIVRKETKTHGTGKLIEGPLRAGDRVLVVEDVTTTGSSALQAIAAVRDFGGEVVAVSTVLDRQAGAAAKFADLGLPFFPLATLADLDLRGS